MSAGRSVNGGAAPHLPAGIFSPYSDGEKGDVGLGARSATQPIGESPAKALFLPVTIRGEMPGRAMRGGAGLSP
ncbi:hypothetical protein FJ948_08365 [Mesorhizobium sp. B2-3-12]|nr:hypothetical protein FJ948_08365 [Mesorhizobium sp. B2-3-12]